jgi:hypothetical protein
MPAPIIAAGIGAAGSLIGGALQSRASGKATDASLQANREAIDFQKQQQEMERRRLASMWDSWYNRRRSLMSMYGLDVPEAENPFTVAGGGMPQANPRGTTLADLADRAYQARSSERMV